MNIIYNTHKHLQSKTKVASKYLQFVPVKISHRVTAVYLWPEPIYKYLYGDSLNRQCHCDLGFPPLVLVLFIDIEIFFISC